jgi:arginase
MFGVDGSIPDAVTLIHYAGRAGDRNERGMIGSRLLAAALSDQLGVLPVEVGTARPALAAQWEEELGVATDDLEALAERYRQVWDAGGRPVTALGRCAAALATLPVVRGRRPGAVIVWLDAHADLNTPETTVSEYLGGMALSGPLGLWQSGLGDGVEETDVILVGTRSIDPPEQLAIDELGLCVLPPGPDLPERLRAAVAGRDVFVHLDVDVLEPGIVAVEYPVPGGLSAADLRDALQVLTETSVVGVQIGELESGSDTAGLSAFLAAVEPLLSSLQGRIESPEERR